MQLNDDDKCFLTTVVRDALVAAVTGCTYYPPESNSRALLEKCGCFVTLKSGGRLCGCIGCFVSDSPLYQTVAKYTRISALDDPRFVGNRLTSADLPSVEITVSALSPLNPCSEPEKIIPGVHGIYIRYGNSSGCFLPQVITEMNWTIEEFWGHCCMDKAGLEWDAWRGAGAECMTFTAEVFDC